MKKILSKSKMREVLPLEPKGGKARSAVFENGKETDLEDSDFKYLKGKKNGPFGFLLKVGDFIDITSGAESAKAETTLSKLDEAIIKLQATKESTVANGKTFHHKAQAKLDKLLDEQKLAKEAAKAV